MSMSGLVLAAAVQMALAVYGQQTASCLRVDDGGWELRLASRHGILEQLNASWSKNPETLALIHKQIRNASFVVIKNALNAQLASDLLDGMETVPRDAWPLQRSAKQLDASYNISSEHLCASLSGQPFKFHHHNIYTYDREISRLPLKVQAFMRFLSSATASAFFHSILHGHKAPNTPEFTDSVFGASYYQHPGGPGLNPDPTTNPNPPCPEGSSSFGDYSTVHDDVVVPIGLYRILSTTRAWGHDTIAYE